MQKSLKDEIKHLEKLINENPKSVLFARLADCYMQMGRLDDAVELCERGVRIHPNYVTGHFVLGKCYFRKKLFDLAEKELKRVTVLDPKFIAAYRELGELAAQNGWKSACEQNFNEILKIDPLNERARQRLAMLRQQFEISAQIQSTSPDLDFRPEKGDASLLTESVLSEEDTSLFDLEELEKEQELPETETTRPEEAIEDFIHEQDLNEDKELGLLEDIFKDTDISDLEAETAKESDQAEAHAEPPKESEKPGYERDFSGFEMPAETSAAEDTEKSFSESGPERETEEISQPAQSFDEFDPFYQLQKEREREKNEVNDSLFPFESEESKLEEPKPEPPAQTFRTEKPEPEISHDEPSPPQQPKQPPMKESLATPTLGEIYAAQRQYAKAIGVYELLLKKDPGNELYKQKIEQLRKRMEEEANEK